MQAVFKKAYQAALSGQGFAIVTILAPRYRKEKMLVLASRESFGRLGTAINPIHRAKIIAESLNAIKQKKSLILELNTPTARKISSRSKVLIEPFADKRKLIICGAGHIALPVSILGKLLDFQIVIIDDRRDFANKRRFAHADKIIIGRHAEQLAKQNLDENSFVMIVTQGNEYDYECLKVVINSRARYMGVISSKAKRIKFFKRLKAEGVNSSLTKRVRIPAGIDIGAQTPEEIAVSIAADIIGQCNQKFVSSEKFKERQRAI